MLKHPVQGFGPGPQDLDFRTWTSGPGLSDLLVLSRNYSDQIERGCVMTLPIENCFFAQCTKPCLVQLFVKRLISLFLGIQKRAVRVIVLTLSGHLLIFATPNQIERGTN